jgi:hypothetical protein
MGIQLGIIDNEKEQAQSNAPAIYISSEPVFDPWIDDEHCQQKLN